MSNNQHVPWFDANDISVRVINTDGKVITEARGVERWKLGGDTVVALGRHDELLLMYKLLPGDRVEKS